MATPNIEVDYNDKRLTDITADEKLAVSKNASTYDSMISQTDKKYQDAINSVGVRDENGNWNEGSMAAIQTDIANQKTEFAIQEIEQNKAQAQKDYTKEQSGAYTDWQKQSNQYGANAEQMAANGLKKTGYSESSLVSMYNTYQNRVATARESYQLVIQNYNNAITEARIQNSSVLAEIALDAMKQGMELTLQGFQYKNQLITDKANKELQIKQFYSNEWKNALDQINTENALKLSAWEAEEESKRQQEQIKIAQQELAIKQAAQKLDEEKFAYEKSKASSISKSSGGGSSSKSSGTVSKTSTGSVTSKGSSTYNKAAESMKSAGAITAGDGGLMTKSEWTRRKASGSNRAETSYASYEDYVNSFTAWRIANPEK